MATASAQNLFNKLCALRDFIARKIDEIAPEMKSHETEAVSEEVGEEVKTPEHDGEQVSVMEASKEFAPSLPPEPKATKTHPGVRRGRNGGLNKSEIIREYMLKNKDARNKDVIEYVKQKYKIDVQPSLVSTVKISMGKGKAKKATKSERASKKAHNDLPMTACCAEALSKAKQGLKLYEVAELIEKSGKYNYTGEKGDKGFLQTVYQGLHTLKQKKSHPGWKGKMPVVLHDKHDRRYKLNPKAKREHVA